MKSLYRILITMIAAAGVAAAQRVVTGTGVADLDIAAVQAAVDGGDSVMLRGHFSFDNPPARRIALPGLMVTILISNAVTISGTLDERGEMTTILGGEIPFAVEGSGVSVRIERLRFVRPKRYAIFADELNGLAIESCVIESVEPLPPLGDPAGIKCGVGVYVATLLGHPTPERPGNPRKVAGKLSIRNNEISVIESADEGIGIMVKSVGTPEKPVDVEITGNTVRNATFKGINLWYIGGRARIESNIVTASAVYAGPKRIGAAGIHCAGSGAYLIAHNRIQVADPTGAGIRLKGTRGGAIERASVTDKDVTMSVAEDAALGERSAGIEIAGLARDCTIRRNTFRGRARVVLSFLPDPSGIPAGNTLGENDHVGFISSPTDRGPAK